MSEPGNSNDLVGDLRREIEAIANQGMAHPSTKRVLTGAALGGVAAALLPFISVPVGLIAGAGYMLYKRVRP
jgi:hypothetical protein